MVDSTFERALLAHLVAGKDERYALPASALPALGRVLHQAARGPRAEAEVRRALQLVTAFRGALRSPGVTRRLVELLKADPIARALARAHLPKSRIDRARAFRQREGRGEALRAPRVDAAPPPAAVPLSRLIHQLPTRAPAATLAAARAGQNRAIAPSARAPRR